MSATSRLGTWPSTITSWTSPFPADCAPTWSAPGTTSSFWPVTGSETTFAAIEDFGIKPGNHTFKAVHAAAARHGEVALGVRAAAVATTGHVHLNPPHDALLSLAVGDEVVVVIVSS
ncbi:MAG: hypothetical protein ACI9OJ_001421 [Myxococcota bacterium]|jgi:hypothetical protein